MSVLTLEANNDLRTAPLSTIFIDEYMPYCNPAFAVVYITGLRCSMYGESSGSKELAARLGMTEDFIVEAWGYWQNEGLIVIDDANYSIRFLPVEHRKPKLQKPADAGITVKEQEEVTIKENIISAPVPTATKPVSALPMYPPEELDIYAQRSVHAKELFNLAEKLFARPLKYHEINMIFGFYDWLGLPEEVIGILIGYCVSAGKTNCNYMEKIAVDWADKGINNAELAESYITAMTKHYRQILKSFGQGRRDPSPREITYMEKWLFKDKIPIELVLEACEITLAATGGAKFSYTDKIICNWKEKGVKTIEESKKATEEFSETAKRTTKKKIKKGFHNLMERELDFVQIEKDEFDYLKKLHQKINKD
jgi:DnaD/phage-associated family protein